MKRNSALAAFIFAGLSVGPVFGATVLDSAEALKALQEGNSRYVAGKSLHPNQDAARRATVATGQNPFVTVLTCADSRVPVEVLFDQGIGDTFVVRVAGNVSDTDEVGSIEYGVGHLHTPLLVVMGHTGCGAVKAVLEGAELHGSIPALVEKIAPAVAQARAANPGADAPTVLDAAVKANVWQSIDDLFKRSAEVRELVEAGKLKVVGAIYGLGSGDVNWLGTHPEQARLLAYTGGGGHEEGAVHGGQGSHATAGAVEHTAPESHSAPVIPTAETAHSAVPSHEPVAADETSSSSTDTIMTSAIVALLVVMIVAGIFWTMRRRNPDSQATGLMSDWTIGRRITFGFAAVLLITAALGLFAYNRLAVIRSEAQDVKEGIPVLESVAALMEGSKDNVGLVYKHIYSASSEDMDKLEALMKANREANAKALEEIEQKACSPAARDLIAQLKTCREDYQKVRDEILVASRAATTPEASAKLCLRARTEMDPLLERYSEAMDKVWDGERKEAEGATTTITTQTSRTTLWMLIGLGLALMMGIGLSIVITRSIGTVLRRVSGSLNDGSQQVASAAGQVSSASQSLAEGSSEQAASIEETSASIEEMSGMTQRNAENAQKANALAKQARAAAERGSSDMQSMNTAMGAIKSSSTDIAKIIKTIDEIAFQTNILALNAAVEAARAGEAGAGFAVVADEVRNLAQRSAQAAKETATQIEGAIGKTVQGAEISTKVSGALEDIVAQVRQLDELVAEVAGASREQSQGIAQVSTAVVQMDKVTQSNAADAEECAGAAEELNAQAESMREAVNELLRLVGSHHQAGVSMAAHDRGPVHHEPFAAQAPASQVPHAPSRAAANPPQRPAAARPAGHSHAPAKHAPTPAVIGHGAFRDF